MEVNLKRIDGDFHFEALGAAGVPVQIDANPEIGGHNAGARPMELLLMGLGGCTAIDVILIMKKQKQIINNFEIKVNGQRTKIEGTEMSPFTAINIHFVFTGQNLDATKIDRAIKLSMEKYCSATAQFNPLANITHSLEILKAE